MKKIVQFQFRSSSSGDFGKRLHDEFIKVGISSSIVSLYAEVPSSSTQFKLGKKHAIVSSLSYKLNEYFTRKSNKDLGLFSYSLFGTNVTHLEQVKQADAFYIHWSHHGFLSLVNIEQLAKLGKPIIIILHDMWYLTGGCHYSFDCDNYTTVCQKCPFFPESNGRDISTVGFEEKLKMYSKYDNLFFVSPSKWLYECARDSALTRNKPLFHIPNVLDRNVFKPFDKKVAREILNIDSEAQVILFGAAFVQSPYKGWEYLKSALGAFHQQEHPENVVVLIFGTEDNAEIAEAIPFRTRFMGQIKDEYALAVLYNAADVFIAPSLADNLPYTIFESLACGTPVVAFNTGGIPDLIQHKVNGYLANYKDAEDLSKGIQYCLNHELQTSPPIEMDNFLSMKKHLELLQYTTLLPSAGNG